MVTRRYCYCRLDRGGIRPFFRFYWKQIQASHFSWVQFSDIFLLVAHVHTHSVSCALQENRGASELKTAFCRDLQRTVEGCIYATSQQISRSIAQYVNQWLFWLLDQSISWAKKADPTAVKYLWKWPSETLVSTVIVCWERCRNRTGNQNVNQQTFFEIVEFPGPAPLRRISFQVSIKICQKFLLHSWWTSHLARQFVPVL